MILLEQYWPQPFRWRSHRPPETFRSHQCVPGNRDSSIEDSNSLCTPGIADLDEAPCSNGVWKATRAG